MSLCHGNGDLVRDGCCYVDGQPCPLRWKFVDGHILEGPALTDLGTTDAYIESLGYNKPTTDKIKAQVVALTYACRAAIEVLIEDTNRLNDRPAFEAAWNAHPDYVAQVRPHWASIEQTLGLAEGEYQCATWRGTSGSQCCFAEDAATNDAKAAGLSDDARTLRRAGGQ